MKNSGNKKAPARVSKALQGFFIQKIENDEVQTENVTLKTMQAIAQAFSAKIDDLIS